MSCRCAQPDCTVLGGVEVILGASKTCYRKERNVLLRRVLANSKPRSGSHGCAVFIAILGSEKRPFQSIDFLRLRKARALSEGTKAASIAPQGPLELSPRIIKPALSGGEPEPREVRVWYPGARVRGEHTPPPRAASKSPERIGSMPRKKFWITSKQPGRCSVLQSKRDARLLSFSRFVFGESYNEMVLRLFPFN